jgi:hypothetical protein
MTWGRSKRWFVLEKGILACYVSHQVFFYFIILVISTTKNKRKEKKRKRALATLSFFISVILNTQMLFR